MTRRKPTQQLLGLMRPDPGRPSTWRGPRELPFVARRREERYLRQKAKRNAEDQSRSL